MWGVFSTACDFLFFSWSGFPLPASFFSKPKKEVDDVHFWVYTVCAVTSAVQYRDGGKWPIAGLVNTTYTVYSICGHFFVRGPLVCVRKLGAREIRL